MNKHLVSSSPRRSLLPAWRLLRALSLGATLLALGTAASAATYYVDNPGGGTGTVASPYSLAQVNANAGNFVGGDKILFKRGATFPTTGLVIPSSGASGNPIIYGSYSGAGVYPGTGALPIIPGVIPDPSIKLNGRNNITLENLDLRNGGQGVSGDNIHNIVVRGVKTSNTAGQGIIFSRGGFITVDNCEVSGMGNGGIYFKGSAAEPLHDGTISNCFVHDARAGTKADGIILHEAAPYDGTTPLGANFLVKDNTATNCNEQGFDITAGSNILLEGNSTSGNNGGSIQVGHSAHDLIIRYHTSVDDKQANTIKGQNITIEYSTFISSSTDNKPLITTRGVPKNFPNDLPTENLIIRNNVFAWNNTVSGPLFSVASAEDTLSFPLTSLHHLTIRNNIFTSLPGKAVPTISWTGPVTPNYDANFKLSNNVYYSPSGTITYTAGGQNYATLAAYQTAFGREQNSKNTNPLLVNPAAGDFRLSSTASSAFDAGVNVPFAYEPAFLTLDFTKPTKVATPQGAARDIGVSEFPVAGSVPAAPANLTATAVSSSQINLTWNPVTPTPTGYRVYRGTTTGGPYATNVSGNLTTTTFNNTTGLAANTWYYYVVRAYNTIGESVNSNQAAAQTAPAGGGVPTFVAAGAVASGAAAITPALPAGLASGDILLLFAETANEIISVSNANGGTWAQATAQGVGTAAASGATRLTLFWSRYNGTQGAPTLSDSGDHQIGRMIAIRGAAASGNPWNVLAGGTETTSDTTASIPGATTTVANTLVVVAGSGEVPDADGTANFSGWTNASLTSLTERTDNTGSAGNGGAIGVATGVKATAGAYGNTSATHATAAKKAMISIAIKP